MNGEQDIRLAVVGCGRWGINHVRTANGLFGDKLVVVSDSNPSAKARVDAISPDIRFTPVIDNVLSDETVNAAIVATPAETHYAVTKALLENGKNVLVEKPITLHSHEAKELISLADKNRLKLMVGHLLLYHPAVLKMKEMISDGKVGQLQYIYSNRLNFGTVRTEENILWSFAPHDISVIQFLMGRKPLQVDAHGASFLQSGIEDTTMTYFWYPGNIQAHIFVSWLHPFKEQRLVAIGDKGMIVFEDSAPDQKLRFYPKCFNNNHGVIEKLDGKYEAIEFTEKPPLAEEQMHFAECVTHNRKPLTDGAHALEVLEILEEAAGSLKRNAVHDD